VITLQAGIAGLERLLSSHPKVWQLQGFGN
jgi:hypothetical protein